MAAPSLAPASDSVSRRRVIRRPISVPLDLVALQSGIPNTMPGRCTDLSEGGLGVIVAGELIPGQPVALELRLPNVGLPIRARAQVRYQDRLHYGLQFVGLSVEQREMIRYWAAQFPPQREETGGDRKRLDETPLLAALDIAPEKEKRDRHLRVRWRRFVLLLAFVMAVAGFGWWEWQSAWNRLEGVSAGLTEAMGATPFQVSSEVMDRQLLYRVDPVYPEAARAAGTEGMVVLDALIAPDGSVKRLRPISGQDVLTQAALEAVQAWKYTPYRSGGQPVEVETTVSVEFRLR